MNRRELFHSLLATPAAAAALAGAVGRDLVLAPGAVSVDLYVYDRGDGRIFGLQLLREPWPVCGDRVRLDFRDLHLVGVVEFTEATSFNGRDGRYMYHVHGRVLEFAGKGLSS